MGTTGAGKTTVGTLLARKLDWRFADADDFHSPENVEKMREGKPLDDADRRPWLQALREEIESWLRTQEDVVLACSALKRSYRDQLRASGDVKFVYLKGSYDEIAQHLEGRQGHFAKRDLLASQLETLEEPEVDEGALVIPVTQSPEEAACSIRQALSFGP